MTTLSNMTHQVSREEDGLQLTCEAFNKGTHFSKTQVAKLSVYREWDDFFGESRLYFMQMFAFYHEHIHGSAGVSCKYILNHSKRPVFVIFEYDLDFFDFKIEIIF